MIPTMTTAASLTLLGLAALSYLCRRVAPQAHWFHEPIGAGLLALLTGVIPSVVQAVQAGGVHASIIVPALTGAVLSLLATSNPTMNASPAGDVVKAPPSLPGTAGIIDMRLLFGLGCVSVGLLGLAILLAGCAPGVDGLRQACTNADTVILSSYQSVVAWNHGEEEKIRAIAPGNPAEALAQLVAQKNTISRVFGVLDRAVADKKKFCASAWDENAKLDWGALLAGAVQVALDVKAAISAILPKPQGWYFRPHPWERA